MFVVVFDCFQMLFFCWGGRGVYVCWLVVCLLVCLLVWFIGSSHAATVWYPDPPVVSVGSVENLHV